MYRGLGHAGVWRGGESWKRGGAALVLLLCVLGSAVVFFQPTVPLAMRTRSPSAPSSPTTAVASIWDSPKPSSSSPSHPQLAFIQTVIPESISFSLVLDRVAKRFGVKTCEVNEGDNREPSFRPEHCKDVFNTGGDVSGDAWFHGGFKHEWMSECIPNVRFATLLQHPVMQTIRREMDQLSNPFYSHYSAYKCAQPRAASHPIELGFSNFTTHLFETIEYCVDRELRYNLTMVALGNTIEHHIPPNVAVDVSVEWITGGGAFPTNLTEFLQQHYYVVGVQEQFHEFLVLIALDNGWPLDAMYYMPCKPYEKEIDLDAFRLHFPVLYDKLELATRREFEAWRWARDSFALHVAGMGDKFHLQVREFEQGLAEYQRANAKPHPLSWELHRYADGESDVC
ncbi:hypothetical protein BASA81_001430 [Batrachochytrium salamandrivorans]|nr:hypothetical protein BASA81_001430 [Batrachochytrium salamandrivorans]